MDKYYKSQRSIRVGAEPCSAEITLTAVPSDHPSKVTFSREAIQDLNSAFGVDVYFQGQNVQAAVLAQIDTANVAGEMSHVGAMSFSVEIINVKISKDLGREASGALLSMASMDAVVQFLEDFERFAESENTY